MNDNKLSWQVSEIEDLEIKKILELKNDGLSQQDIANEMELSKATICRRLKQSKNVSQFQSLGNETMKQSNKK